jgi:hypothetical protein
VIGRQRIDGEIFGFARFSDAEIARLDRLATRGAMTHPVLAGAGHWVHVDAPDALSALLVQSLNGR